MRIEVPIGELNDYLVREGTLHRLRVNEVGEIEVAFEATLSKDVAGLRVNKTVPLIAVVREHHGHGSSLHLTLVAKSGYVGKTHIPTKWYRNKIAEEIAKLRLRFSLEEGAVVSAAASPEEMAVTLDLDQVGAAIGRRLNLEVRLRDVSLGDPLTLTAHVGHGSRIGETASSDHSQAGSSALQERQSITQIRT